MHLEADVCGGTFGALDAQTIVDGGARAATLVAATLGGSACRYQ